MAPLIRAVWIKNELEHVLMLTIYHAIGDGISSAYVVRDLLTALSGKPLAVLPFQKSVSELLGLPAVEVSSDEQGGEMTNLPLFTRRQQIMPQVELLTLPKKLTEQLVLSARKEGTTIQGALCAAFVRASRSLSEEWKNKAVRIATPVSIREVIGAGEGSSLAFISRKPIFEAGIDDDFWTLARHATDVLKGAKEMGNVHSGVMALHNMIFGDQEVNELAEQLQNVHVPRELMISNLGSLDFDTQFGTLKLEALWGPLALSGYSGEQTIGVATVDGAMYLSLVSRTPLKKLLATAEGELVAISESDY